MRNAMRTLLALFVLTAVTAALLLQLQIRHPLQATRGSDPETASFLSLRSAVFAAVTALSPHERRALASRDGSSFTELVLSDIGSFAENGFRIPGEDDGTPSLRAFLAMKGDTCLMAVFRTREDAALAQALRAALGSSAGTGSACRGASCQKGGVDLEGFVPDGFPADGLTVSTAYLACPAFSFVSEN